MQTASKPWSHIRIHFRSGWWPLCPFKTKLGWCVVRPPISDQMGVIKTDCIVTGIIVEDHATGKHHFAIRKCVKEDGISDLLKKLYATDCILGGWTFSKSVKRRGDSMLFFNKGRDGVIRGGIKKIYETFSISLKETQTFKAY